MNKASKSRNRSPNHSKSVDTIANAYKPSEQSRQFIPKMNQTQTAKLVSRLSSSIRGSDGQYLKVVERQMAEVKGRCEKMYSLNELLYIMRSNQMSLRCMQHNNAFTLYCLTQRKVLCVNCTYGEAKHRTHRVLPLKDCAVHIDKDNQLFQKSLSDRMAKLEEGMRAAQRNSALLKQDLQKIIQKMESTHIRELNQLQRKHQLKKQKIRERYQEAIGKTKYLQQMIGQFKSQLEASLSVVGVPKYSQETTDPVARQVYCSLFAEMIKVDIQDISDKQLQKLSFLSQF